MKANLYSRSLRFSMIMPLLGFLLSLGLLFPYRKALAAEVLFAVSPRPVTLQSLPSNIDIDALAAVASKFNFDPDGRDKRYMQVTALNLPALISDLPIAMFSKSHTSWHPAGIDFKAWRAIVYPIIGVFFWWLVGRGLDALLKPDFHLNWPEFVVSALLLIGAAAICLGWVTGTTPEERADHSLVWFAAGAILWFFLEGIIVAGWVKQAIMHRRLTRLHQA